MFGFGLSGGHSTLQFNMSCVAWAECLDSVVRWPFSLAVRSEGFSAGPLARSSSRMPRGATSQLRASPGHLRFLRPLPRGLKLVDLQNKFNAVGSPGHFVGQEVLNVASGPEGWVELSAKRMSWQLALLQHKVRQGVPWSGRCWQDRDDASHTGRAACLARTLTQTHLALHG